MFGQVQAVKLNRMMLLLIAPILLAPDVGWAQAAATPPSSGKSPTETARDAAATWAGFGAAQQLFGPTSPTAPVGGVTTSSGTVIAPADVTAHIPTQGQPQPVQDGLLRSAPPAIGVDADGHGTIVSGASIR